MKTIHEMAVEYGEKHQGTCNIEDFEAGALAVVLIFFKIDQESFDNDALSCAVENAIGDLTIDYSYEELKSRNADV